MIYSAAMKTRPAHSENLRRVRIEKPETSPSSLRPAQITIPSQVSMLSFQVLLGLAYVFSFMVFYLVFLA